MGKTPKVEREGSVTGQTPATDAPSPPQAPPARPQTLFRLRDVVLGLLFVLAAITALVVVVFGFTGEAVLVLVALLFGVILFVLLLAALAVGGPITPRTFATILEKALEIVGGAVAGLISTISKWIDRSGKGK